MCRRIAKTHDVKWSGRQEFQVRMRHDTGDQVTDLHNVLFNHGRELVHAMSLERQPHFECLEIARQLQPTLAKWLPTCRDPPGCSRQVRRRTSECGAVYRG